MKREDKAYSLGPYSKIRGEEQWIRLTEGCPHNCPWCREPTEFKVFDIPKIERNRVGVMDMNLLAKPESLQLIKDLGQITVKGKVVYYKMICGVDYRFLTQENALALKKSRFRCPHIAWDNHLDQQWKIKAALDTLEAVGWKKHEMMVFMIANHPLISFKETMRKFLCCVRWGVQVDFCVYDNQIKSPWISIGWTEDEITQAQWLEHRCNKIVRYGSFDPEVKDEKS